MQMTCSIEVSDKLKFLQTTTMSIHIKLQQFARVQSQAITFPEIVFKFNVQSPRSRLRTNVHSRTIELNKNTRLVLNLLSFTAELIHVYEQK